MTKFFCSLIFFLLISLKAQGSSLWTISNAYASRDGKVKIQKDGYGLYVEVDYKESPTSNSEKGKFSLSLISSKTIFTSNCLSFSNYVCSEHNCQTDTTSSEELIYPFFSATAKRSKIEAYLDHQGWSLKTNAYLTETCSAKISGIGYERVGIIGMSQNEDSLTNYLSSSNDGFVFSVEIEKEGAGGALSFSKNETKLSSLAKKNTLQIESGSQWRVPSTSASLNIDGSVLNTQLSLMFEPMSVVIALPLSVFNHIIQSFNKAPYSCPSDNYKPVCSSSEKIYIKNLPAIVLEIQGQKISIPPSIYIHEDPETLTDKFTIHFMAVDPSLAEINYINNNFKDTIIFDSHVMSHYYTIFSKDKIELYEPITKTQSSSSWLGPLLLMVIAILVVVIGLVKFMNWRKQKYANLAALQNSQNPLIQAPPTPQQA